MAAALLLAWFVLFAALVLLPRFVLFAALVLLAGLTAALLMARFLVGVCHAHLLGFECTNVLPSPYR